MRRTGAWQKKGLVLLLAVVTTVSGSHMVLAETSTSPNYQVTEMQLGTGITQEGCSDQYCAQVSIGDMTTGSSSSPEFTAEFFGPEDPEEPLIEVIVHPGESNLGVLSTEETATKESIVQIRTHLTDGYVLQLVGNAPVFEDHSLYTPSSPTESQPGTEQFGINLVRNTQPAMGADPVQQPDEEELYGQPLEDYATANFFKYLSGDTVARSTAESGQTNYTISMIINISSSTPAGHYTGDYSVVVVPLF